MWPQFPKLKSHRTTLLKIKLRFIITNACVCVCQVQAGCRGIETTTQTSIIKPWDATKSRLEGNL